VRDAPWVNRQPLKILFDPSARLASVTNPALIEGILTKTFAAGGASDGKVVLIYKKDRPLPPWLALDPSRLFLLEVNSRDEAFASLLGALTAPPFITWYGTGIQSILVEGGPMLLNHLTQIRAIDAFHVFVTPAFLSLSSHQIAPSISPLNNQVASMERYKLLQGMTIGDDQLIEFMPRDRFEKIFTPVPHVLPTSKS
jgi:riboflavin biosynthesis pyrimidine reductase